jgi:hypothetical protein
LIDTVLCCPFAVFIFSAALKLGSFCHFLSRASSAPVAAAAAATSAAAAAAKYIDLFSGAENVSFWR